MENKLDMVLINKISNVFKQIRAYNSLLNIIRDSNVIYTTPDYKKPLLKKNKEGQVIGIEVQLHLVKENKGDSSVQLNINKTSPEYFSLSYTLPSTLHLSTSNTQKDFESLIITLGLTADKFPPNKVTFHYTHVRSILMQVCSVYKADDITYTNVQTSTSNHPQEIIDELNYIQDAILGTLINHNSNNADNHAEERPYRSDPRNAPVAPVSKEIYENFKTAKDYAMYRETNPIEKPKPAGFFSQWG